MDNVKCAHDSASGIDKISNEMLRGETGGETSLKRNKKVVQIGEDSVKYAVCLLMALFFPILFSTNTPPPMMFFLLCLYPIIFILWIEVGFGNKNQYWPVFALAVVSTYGLTVALSFTDNLYMNVAMCVSLLMIGYNTMNYFNKNYNKEEFMSVQLLKNEKGDVKTINDYYKYILRMCFTSLIIMDCFFYYEMKSSYMGMLSKSNIIGILSLAYICIWAVVLMFLTDSKITNNSTNIITVMLLIFMSCIGMTVVFIVKNGIGVNEAAEESLVMIALSFLSTYLFIKAEYIREAFKLQQT